MMWLVPAVVAVVVVVPVLLAVRRVAAEAVEFRREIIRFSDLRPALVELRTEARDLQTSAIRRFR